MSEASPSASNELLRLPYRPVALLLDFDGVILQSVRIKVDAYVDVYAGENPDKLAAVLEYQRAHGGVTRRVKFRYFERHIFGRDAADERIEALSRQYTRRVHDAVLGCPFVDGAREFLDRAHGRTDMHVISGTPIDELADIVRRRDLGSFFASVHGAPETKPEAFAAILAAHGYDPTRVLAIGDATTELDAARSLGMPFLGIVAGDEPDPFPADVATMPSLDGLAGRLGLDSER